MPPSATWRIERITVTIKDFIHGFTVVGIFVTAVMIAICFSIYTDSVLGFWLVLLMETVIIAGVDEYAVVFKTPLTVNEKTPEESNPPSMVHVPTQSIDREKEKLEADNFLLWQSIKNIREMNKEIATEAIAIMDDNGRKNEEGNSTMLWDEDWNNLRQLLLDILGDE